jgi:uncharacterized protein DUF4221
MKESKEKSGMFLRVNLMLVVFLNLSCLHHCLGQVYPVLIKNGTFSIPLDFATGFTSDCIQVFDINGVKYLAFGYRKDRKINIYDYTKRKLIKVIKYKLEGPDGVGSDIPAFFIENFDSIYIYSYWEKTIYLTSAEGEIKDKFKIPDSEKYPIIEPGTMCPLIKAGNFLYLSGILIGASHSTIVDKPLLEIDFEKHKIRTVGFSPYITKMWNYYRKNGAKYDYVTGKNFFVIGYDMSDSLYLVHGDISHRFLSKSMYLKDIQPLSKDKEYASSKDEKYAFLVSDSYWGVKYDPFQKLYYRFAIKGRSMKEVYAFKLAEMTVIVMDENLKKLGEIELPYNSYIDMSFVTEEGLHIANKKIYDEVNEDVLTFDVYKINR